MKSQDDRYTVAQESEAFPHFTINKAPPAISSGNYGGTLAFFERLEVIRANYDELVGRGVYVNGDCGFHVRSDVEGEAVFALCQQYLLGKNRSLKWITHEALESQS